MSKSAARRMGPASYGAAGTWPRGPFDRAKDAGTQQAVRFAADLAMAVRLARTARFWTQAELAQKAGVDRGTISRLEAGTTWVDLFSVARTAAALELSITVEPRD